jgi:hypothetical protein
VSKGAVPLPLQLQLSPPATSVGFCPKSPESRARKIDPGDFGQKGNLPGELCGGANVLALTLALNVLALTPVLTLALMLALTLALSKTWRSLVIALLGDIGTEPKRLSPLSLSLSISMVPMLQSREALQ